MESGSGIFEEHAGHAPLPRLGATTACASARVSVAWVQQGVTCSPRSTWISTPPGRARARTSAPALVSGADWITVKFLAYLAVLDGRQPALRTTTWPAEKGVSKLARSARIHGKPPGILGRRIRARTRSPTMSSCCSARCRRCGQQRIDGDVVARELDGTDSRQRERDRQRCTTSAYGYRRCAGLRGRGVDDGDYIEVRGDRDRVACAMA